MTVFRGALAAALLSVAALARGAESTGGHALLVTVDDLPIGAGSLHADPAERESITRKLLAILARHRIFAVGFVITGHVAGERDEALLVRWLAAGHLLGNHSRSHLDYTKTAAEAYIADVEAGRAWLAGFLARNRQPAPRYFRFPYLREGDTGEKLDAVRAYLERSGQANLPVTIDDQDWSFEKPWVDARRAGDKAALARVGEDYQLALRLEVETQTALGDELLGRAVPQVLLLHANEVGAAQWDALFTWLEQRGYRFATAGEVMADPALATPQRFLSSYGGSLWQRVAHERQSERVRVAIGDLLRDQAAAWTRGDLEAFCSVYAEDAVFLTPSGLTRGRAAVLERYRARYPSTAAMGTLTLEPVELREAWGNEATALGDAQPSRTHGVSVVARWTLTRTDGSSASGLTLLVLLRQSGQWVIVQDASM